MKHKPDEFDDAPEVRVNRSSSGPPPLPKKANPRKTTAKPTSTLKKNQEAAQGGRSSTFVWMTIAGGLSIGLVVTILLFFILRPKTQETQIAKSNSETKSAGVQEGTSLPPKVFPSDTDSSGPVVADQKTIQVPESTDDLFEQKEASASGDSKLPQERKPNTEPDSEVMQRPDVQSATDPQEDSVRSSAELDRLIETAATLVKTVKGKEAIATFKEAVVTLKKASNRYPKELRGDFYLGLLHSGIGVNDPKTAELHFKRVLDRAPGHIATMNNLALISVKADKFAQARNYLGLAGKTMPRAMEVNQNIGRLVNQAKLLEIKSDEFKRITGLNTESAAYRGDMGWIYMPLDDSAKAREEYKSFCRNGNLEDPSCSICNGFGSLPCKTCGREGAVVQMGTMAGSVNSIYGSISTSTPTAATLRCTTCGGDGRVDCPNCDDGRDPSLKRH